MFKSRLDILRSGFSAEAPRTGPKARTRVWLINKGSAPPEKPRILQRSHVSHPARGLHGQLVLAQATTRPGPLLFCTIRCAGPGQGWYKATKPASPLQGEHSSSRAQYHRESGRGSGGRHHSPAAGLSFSGQIMFRWGWGGETVCVTTHGFCQPHEIWDSAEAFKHTVHTPVRNRGHK